MKVYQEVPKILRAHEEAAFCHMFLEEYRDKKQVGEVTDHKYLIFVQL